jgi:hypothetical protein
LALTTSCLHWSYKFAIVTNAVAGFSAAWSYRSCASEARSKEE